jgi:phenylalanyl-tRNA synthetase alpha chain
VRRHSLKKWIYRSIHQRGNALQILDNILQEATAAIHAAQDLKALEACRIQFLGKKGQLTEYLKKLGTLPADERPIAGQKINAIKECILLLLNEQNEKLNQSAIQQKLQHETIDITLPGRKKREGNNHPISHSFAEIKRIFTTLGCSFMEGPEIEDDYHNFSALNIPAYHPARAMQDTFYFANQLLLRTHMSTVQIRTMAKTPAPFRIIAMGRVYRRDFDLTHTPMFHQLECLMIDKNINFAVLKGLLNYFVKEFFSEEIPLRFRPSFFPFTEPSAEVDIQCLSCKGKGCKICKQSGYLEVLGCGLVHSNVLTMAGINPKNYRGLAFGVGIDRLTLLKYRINDLRALFENDIRFLNQFKNTL